MEEMKVVSQMVKYLAGERIWDSATSGLEGEGAFLRSGQDHRCCDSTGKIQCRIPDQRKHPNHGSLRQRNRGLFGFTVSGPQDGDHHAEPRGRVGLRGGQAILQSP